MALAGPVAAQGALEEIIVTAEFREASVQDTPIAITAVTSEMLDARAQTSVFEVAAQAPNVSLMPGGPARSGMMAYIRGIGQSDFIAALEPGVGVYVDDVYYSQLTGSLVDLLDLDRVEVLRGPQGTLAGRNSIGGAIKLYSRKPGEGGDDAGSLQVGYGSYHKVDLRGTADLTIFEDKLYARVAGAARSRDGYVDVLDYGCVYPGSGITTNRVADGCLVDKWGEQNYTTGRVQLRWLVNDDLEVNFSGDYLNDTSGSPAGVLLWGDRSAIEANPANPTMSGDDGDPLTPPILYRNHNFVPYGEFAPANALNDPYVNFATLHDPNTGAIFGTLPDGTPLRRDVPWKPLTLPSRNFIRSWGVSGRVDWNINEQHQATSITAYREYDTWMTWDSDYSPIAVTMLDNRLDNYSLTQELRLNSTWMDGVLDTTVGWFYLDQNSHYEARVVLPYALLDFIHGPDPTPASTWAAFGHAVWHVNNRLNISGGLRYSDEQKDYTHFRHNPDNSDIALPGSALFPVNVRILGVNGLLAQFEDDRLDYRVAIDYAVNDDFLAYGSISTGYKSGGVNPRPFFPEQLNTFNPETLTSYEAGFKSTWLDSTLRLNAAMFYTEYEDIQLTLNECEVPGFIDPDGINAPCAKPANVGSAEIFGVEFEAEWYPTDNFSLDGSLSILDFEYVNVDALALGGSSIAALDMITPYTPEMKWSFGAQYEMGFGENGNVTARIDASYQDEVYSEPTNGPLNLIEDRTLVNGRIWWDDSDRDWTIAIEVTNLTDEVYYHTKFDQANSVGQVTGQPALPRTYGISIRRNF
jgi:iron complex outermembrane receptor protein